jgi:protein O-GlcNAc transferase
MIPVKTAFDFGESASKSAAERAIIELISRGNLALAEVKAREMFGNRDDHSKALNFLGCIAVACGLMQKAEEFFRIAAGLTPNWAAPTNNLESFASPSKDTETSQLRSESQRFLLIKAWGAGFWSDVSHVIGLTLLAELTNRTPIVHWAGNSLFSADTAANAFDAFFEPVADLSVEALRTSSSLEIWPPKWNQENLFAAEVNKWQGPFSRVAGIYLLGREEELIVSDFFTSVFDLTLWIPKQDPKYAMTFEALYTYLVRKYLRPKREIMESAIAFYNKHLLHSKFISVHVRGSDKVTERPDLDDLNAQYHRIIDEFRRLYDAPTVFLMTDDTRLLDDYIKRYGRDLVFTDCERTSTSRGVHFSRRHDMQRLGIEVMVDAYVAVNGVAFVGNGSSNPSQMVRYLGTWPKERVCLLGDNFYRQQIELLHQI